MRRPPLLPLRALLAAVACLLAAGCGGRGEDVSGAAVAPSGTAAGTDAGAAADASDLLDGRVREVVDAETLIVALPAGPARVRVIGVDAPSLEPQPGGGPACGAVAARAAVVRLALGRPVRLAIGVEPADPAGRMLARVDLLDGPGAGSDLASALVLQGHARVRVRAPNTAQKAALLSLEERARAEGAGLWGACGAARAFPGATGS